MVLITGATGLLGGHLIAKIMQQCGNKKIIAAKRRTSNLSITKKILSYYFDDAEKYFKEIKWVEVDFFNPVEVQEMIEKFQIQEVHHCAGLVSFNNRRRQEILKTNVEITASLVNACINTDIKFCYVSSIAALLNQFIHDDITEKTFWQAGKHEYAYALSKYFGECEVWRGIEEGLKAVIVNPGIIVGAGNWNTGWGMLVKKAYQTIPFYTTGITGYVAVEDVAEIMIQLMEREIFSQRFILIEDNYSFKEILDELHLSLSKPVPEREAKKWMLELVRYAEALYSNINSKYEPNFTKATVQGALMKKHYNNSLIKETLKYNFRKTKPYIHSVSQKYLEEKKTH